MRVLTVVFAVMLCGAARAQDRATLQVDAVELVEGKEVAGKAELSVERDGLTYWFSSEYNKAAFNTEPDKYEIRWAGACARMGPLSGKGSAQLFAVHEGHIYLFASSACRKAFLAGPEKFLERDEGPPAATPESAAEGLKLLDKAAAAMSGTLKFDDLKSVRLVQEGTAKDRDEVVKTSHTVSFQFPDRARRLTTWHTYYWGEVLAPDEAYFVSAMSPTTMVESQKRILEREVSHNPVMVIRGRRLPGTVVAHLPREELDGRPVEVVAVHRVGGTTKALIDPESGQIVALRYRARGPNLTLGSIEMRLSNYKDVGGVTLPMTQHVSFEGKPSDEQSFTYASIRVDCVETKEFEKPGRP